MSINVTLLQSMIDLTASIGCLCCYMKPASFQVLLSRALKSHQHWNLNIKLEFKYNQSYILTYLVSYLLSYLLVRKLLSKFMINDTFSERCDSKKINFYISIWMEWMKLDNWHEQVISLWHWTSSGHNLTRRSQRRRRRRRKSPAATITSSPSLTFDFDFMDVNTW